MKALITGVNGFVGGYLADCLLAQGVDVHGTFIITTDLDKVDCRITLHELDITDKLAVQKTLDQVKPDFIFHLAAQSSAAISWKKPQMTVEININGTLNILESIRELGTSPRILLIGSSEEYGFISPEDVPVSEEQMPVPGNPYAISKLAQSMLGQLYSRSYRMNIVMVRAFNHIGPKQSPIFAVADFAKRIAEIEKGLTEPILKVGNLEAIRDFTDVRDIVRAYWMLVQKGKPGQVYNVGSGHGMKIQEILELLLKRSKVSISLEEDPDRLRPSDIPMMIAEVSKINEEIGWSPEIELDKTLDDIMHYWREQINGVI